MQAVLTYIKSVGNISTDVATLLIVFFAFFFYTLYFGKNRTISFILAYYPALFLYNAFPWVSKLLILTGPKMLALNKVGIFLIFLLPLSIVINRYIFADSGAGGVHILRVGGLALVCLTLVLLFSYTVVDLSLFHDFGSHIDVLFSNPTKDWIGNLAPLVLLAFL
jgi:hypothetical protein